MYLKKRKRLISRGEGGRRQATQSSLSVWVSPCGKMSTRPFPMEPTTNDWDILYLSTCISHCTPKKHTRWYPFQFQPLICFFSDKACQRMRILEKCTKCNTQNHHFPESPWKFSLVQSNTDHPPLSFLVPIDFCGFLLWLKFGWF